MSTPKWTPELATRCLAAARGARTDPETAESLREALATSEAALFDARFLGAADRVALEDAVKRANASEAARLAAEERARVLVTAVRAHHSAISRLDDHVERMDCYDTECRHASHEAESEAKAAVDKLLRAHQAPAAAAKAPA